MRPATSYSLLLRREGKRARGGIETGREGPPGTATTGPILIVLVGYTTNRPRRDRQEDTRLEQALQKLLEAARESPDPEIFKHLGEVYYSLGQWESADKEWQEGSFQNPLKGSKDEQIYLWI